MFKIYFYIIIVFFIVIFCSSTITVYAMTASQTRNDDIIEIGARVFGDDSLDADSFDIEKSETILYTKIGKYIALVLQALATVLLGVIIYAGFLWLTAGGNTEQVSKAKLWITNGIIGMVILGSAYLIVGFIITKTLGSNTTALLVPSSSVNVLNPLVINIKNV